MVPFPFSKTLRLENPLLCIDNQSVSVSVILLYKGHIVFPSLKYQNISEYRK